MNICDKYYWITNHPAYVPFGRDAIIEITPHMVCPETNRVEKIQSVNTKLQFWVELMVPYFDEQFNQETHAHEWELDCGGDTWEEAVENLYNGVIAKYGNYTKEDLNKHREEGMKGFNFDAFIASIKTIPVGDADYEYAEPVMYTMEEIVELRNEIDVMKKYEDVLRTKASDKTISMEEYYEIECEQMAIDHDLTIARASLEAGYDVDRYGFPK